MLKQKIESFLDKTWFNFSNMVLEELYIVYIGATDCDDITKLIKEKLTYKVCNQSYVSPSSSIYKLSDYITIKNTNCTLVVIVDSYDNVDVEDEFLLGDKFHYSSLMISLEGSCDFIYNFPNKEKLYRYVLRDKEYTMDQLLYRYLEYTVDSINVYKEEDEEPASISDYIDIVVKSFFVPEFLVELIERADTLEEAYSLMESKDYNGIFIRDIGSHYLVKYLECLEDKRQLEYVSSQNLNKDEIETIHNMFN